MKSRYWALLSLVLFLGAAFLWELGERDYARRHPATDGAGTNAPVKSSKWNFFKRAPAPAERAATPAQPPLALLSVTGDPRFPYRLRNTIRPDAELFRSETAVLLRNAFVETADSGRLQIPAHLRSLGDPGSFIVQARGPIDEAFRATLRTAGAEIVSYVPNNSYLARGNANVARQVAGSPLVRSLLAFEPYYKLEPELLALAVNRQPLPVGRWLNVVLFSGTRDATLADLRARGAELIQEQPFPFGHVVTILPAPDSLVELAQMPAVQNIEPYRERVLANDLARVRMDVAADTLTGVNWRSLTGAGVRIGLNGSGVDLAHADLAGRVFTDANSPTVDVTGHDTHVGAIIAGLGTITAPSTTNGSLIGASFRGKAPGAQVYPLSIFTNLATDFWLQTNHAKLSNVFIGNNSWGYGFSGYDIAAASWDAAARDALPHRPGDQPITWVFAAGNFGGANSGGTGGGADTINTPATAKNVISVGALESFRLVPNTTNDPIATAHTDSSSQVADFSSRGNVGVGVEGTAGRFKPDLVAPGTYIASARASTFTTPTDSDNALGSSQLRYESGTSMAAGGVSGVLALMEEFFRVNYSVTNSPALNKALLINRARSAGPAYDLAVINPVTHQGWGVPSLSNTIPDPAGLTLSFLTNATTANNRIVIVEQSAFLTNHIISGQTQSFDILLPNGPTTNSPLRITLAWTDPPGNPVTSIKLVNDLDLVVTNLIANGRIFEGNNFAPGGVFTDPNIPGNSISPRDFVNNVENVFIAGPHTNGAGGLAYRVNVVGRRVHVNAVTGNTNAVAQDYVLVISTDTNSTISVRTSAAGFSGTTNRLATVLTNGIPLNNERVGGNFQRFAANTNGLTNQWNFYVFTNQNLPASLTNFSTNIISGITNVSTNIVNPPITNGGPYVAFTTFLPPNLARTRNKEADLDLFVTRTLFPPAAGASGLTNLVPAVLSDPATLRSTNRGGAELIIRSNSALGEIFFIGVKSEDQQGGTYGLLALASSVPFSSTNTNGNVVVTLFPLPVEIPDGLPESPGVVQMFGICPVSTNVQTVYMTNVVMHENLGDLSMTLTHNSTAVTLKSHTVSPGNTVGTGWATNTLIYDDYLYAPDGPGEMTAWLGQDAIGLWFLDVEDNAFSHTGRVVSATIELGSRTNYPPGTNVYNRTITLQSGQSFLDFLTVPVTATNLQVSIFGLPSPGPVGQQVDLLAAFGFPPSPTNLLSTNLAPLILSVTDLNNSIPPPHLTISQSTTPQLTAGNWFFRLLNNTAGALTLTIRYDLGLNLALADTRTYAVESQTVFLDDATTNFYLPIPDNRVIASVQVGLSLQHERASDLAIHLVAPSGTKSLLMENRGGITGTNIFANFTENTNLSTSVITNVATGQFHHYDFLMPVKFIPPPFTNIISPPRLLTNTTYGTASSNEVPTSLAISGSALYLAGNVTPFIPVVVDGFVANYALPITNSLQPTNWAAPNWPGTASGTRNGDTFFHGVGASVDGVYAAGVTRDYFLTAQSPVGGQQTHIYDLDTGTTNGVVIINYNFYTVLDQMTVYYQGIQLTNTLMTNGARTLNLPFQGSSTFVRIIMNEFGNPSPGTAWIYNVAVNAIGAPFYFVSTHSGGPGSAGFVDSTNSASIRYNTPAGVALHTNGNLYVSDFANNRVRIVTPLGEITNTFATVTSPRGLAFNSTLTRLYVACADHVIREVDVATAAVSVYAGLAATTGTTDAPAGPASSARFNSPESVALDAAGNVYVADMGNHSLRRVTPGGLVTTLAGLSGTAGTTDNVVGTLARFNGPADVKVNGAGTFLYVTDSTNQAIRRVNLATLLVDTHAGLIGSGGTLDGAGTAARFLGPFGLAIDGSDNVYVTSTNQTIRKVTPGASVTTVAGLTTVSGANDGIGATARFNRPQHPAADSQGMIFVPDSLNHTIRRGLPAFVTPKEKAIAVFYPNSGPVTGAPAGNGAVWLSRGITNNVFGVEGTDRFRGIAVNAENGTNFLYAAGSAQFSPTAGTPERAFLTKFATNGLGVWTSGYLPPATATNTTNLAGGIVTIPVTFGGSNYTAVPGVVIEDVTGTGSGATATAQISAAGVVTNVLVNTPGSGYTRPRVRIDAPISLANPAHALTIAYGTNIIIAGFTNDNASPLITNNVPFLMAFTTNGAIRWARISTNTRGHFNAVAMVGTNIIALGVSNAPGSTTQTDGYMERWDLAGNRLASNRANLNLLLGTTGVISGAIGFQCPDRVYAVGTITNGGGADAVLLEIDPGTLTVVSRVTINLPGSTYSSGKAIATDGEDIYVTVEGGNGSAGIFRYRVKNYYLPEEPLTPFIGESTWFGTNNQWRLQVWDNRAGGTNTAAQLVCWDLKFTYASSNTPASFLNLTTPFFGTLLANQPRYFVVNVPGAASFATNRITASGNVRVTYNLVGAPRPGTLGNVVLLNGVTSGTNVMSTSSVARLRPGSRYYLAVEPAEGVDNVTFTLAVDVDQQVPPQVILPLTNGAFTSGTIAKTADLTHYHFDVATNASGALFELVPASGNLNLYLRRSNAGLTLPTTSTFDYRSLNFGTAIEQVFLVTNSATATALTPGRWYLGVQNADLLPLSFTVRASQFTGTPYTIVTAPANAAFASATTPGNAPNTLFKLTVPSSEKAILFELSNLTGPGDLLVRRAAFPLSTAFDASNVRPGTTPESVAVRTNASLPDLGGDWYFGVLNPQPTHVNYTVVARFATGGVLASGTPIQLARPPGTGLLTGGTGFGFDLDVVPGEKYQVQYKTNLVSPDWQVLTNLVAPVGGVINFVHANALTNKNLYYRIVQVP